MESFIMMENYKEWSFGDLLTEYLAEWVFFRTEIAFEKLPWSLQIEVRRITSVLNAFTGGSYDPTTADGKQGIVDAFEKGFNLQDELCTDNQLEELKVVLPQVDDLYSEFEVEKPKISEFYEYLFATYQASYDYVTAFDDLIDRLYTDAFVVVDAFKRKKINSHILQNIKIIFRCFDILLGDLVNKRFTTAELIENFGYPDEDHEKLLEFNKKWCRFHGIKLSDFRKSRNYAARVGYSTLGFR